ncbi:MAG: hypothetical protein F4187_07680 [Gemmatimonadetes bacterium]|nr:hypothetical protein [Gemmatimonadota bacterium]
MPAPFELPGESETDGVGEAVVGAEAEDAPDATPQGRIRRCDQGLRTAEGRSNQYDAAGTDAGILAHMFDGQPQGLQRRGRIEPQLAPLAHLGHQDNGPGTGERDREACDGQVVGPRNGRAVEDHPAGPGRPLGRRTMAPRLDSVLAASDPDIFRDHAAGRLARRGSGPGRQPPKRPHVPPGTS